MTSAVMLDPWSYKISDDWRGPCDEPLPKEAKFVKAKITQEDTKLFALRFLKLKPLAILQRSINHITSIRAQRGLRTWKAFRDIMNAQEKIMWGAMNRMRNLALSRAWEQWQVLHRSATKIVPQP